MLDANTINKIAAGEVVERPASVVKELVENAIDAKATRIEIEILNGGKSYIKVSDNGIGMDRDDANLAVCSHATSKITSVADLMSVSTLGFRGEALPTIASVSKFSLWTRQQGNELGTFIQLKGGRDKLIENQGCALGTTILVEDLFFNTPARKKFLKQNSTEGNKISEFLMKLALSRPSIAFKLLSGNKMILNTPGSGSLIECFESIYGREVASSMLEINFQDRFDKNLKLHGLVSTPNLTKSYRSCQTFIVNGRVIGNRAISKAVDEAYQSKVPKGNYPLVVLVLDVEPTTVDINVHPQKAEVRFEDDGVIFRAVRQSVIESLERRQYAEREMQSPSPIPVEQPTVEDPIVKEPIEDQKIKEPIVEEHEDIVPAAPPSLIEQRDREVEQPKVDQQSKVEKPKVEDQPTEPLFAERMTPKKLTPLGQVALCYIVAKDDDALYLVDQHAAHERIIFDRLASSKDGVPAQQLLVPLTPGFDERERLIIANNLELFQRLGFTLEQDAEGRYQLIEVPVDVQDADSESMLREILSSLPTVDDSFGDDAQQRKVLAKNIREACLATTACRAAIKAGQVLDLKQMQILLSELSKTRFPFTCPHGRPTIIEFDSDKLATMFKRKGF